MLVDRLAFDLVEAVQGGGVLQKVLRRVFQLKQLLGPAGDRARKDFLLGDENFLGLDPGPLPVLFLLRLGDVLFPFGRGLAFAFLVGAVQGRAQTQGELALDAAPVQQFGLVGRHFHGHGRGRSASPLFRPSLVLVHGQNEHVFQNRVGEDPAVLHLAREEDVDTRLGLHEAACHFLGVDLQGDRFPARPRVDAQPAVQMALLKDCRRRQRRQRHLSGQRLLDLILLVAGSLLWIELKGVLGHENLGHFFVFDPVLRVFEQLSRRDVFFHHQDAKFLFALGRLHGSELGGQIRCHQTAADGHDQ